MALPVTTSLVEDSAAALAAGGWRYTQRQLYYATCARAETAPSDAASNGEIGLGVLLILIGLILIGIKVAFALFVTLGVALILAGVLGRLRRPKLSGRLLALSFDDFRSRFGVARHRGLIPPDRGPRRRRQPPTDGDRERHSSTCGDDRGQRSIEPSSALQVSGGRRRRDPGPGRAAIVSTMRHHGLRAGAGPSRRRGGRRGRRPPPREVDGPSQQVIEGAPARLPRDLSMLLDRDEIDWLLSGRRVGLATLRPEVAMDRVGRRSARLAPSRRCPAASSLSISGELGA